MKEFKTRFGPPRVVRGLNFFLHLLLLASAGSTVRLWPDLSLLLLVLLAVFTVFGLLLLGLGSVSFVFERRQQRRRDARAAEILLAVQGGERRHYSLYLRGFDTMGQLRDTVDEYEGAIDSEVLIGTVVESTMPLIALGRPGVDYFGAGRIATTDASWKSDFKVLVRKAGVVFLVPSDGPGTIFELEHIHRHDFWFKTVLVMPRGGRRYGWEERWESTRAQVKDFGVSLPAFEWSGAVFTLGPMGEVQAFQPISEKGVVAAIAHVLSGLLSERLALHGIGPVPQ